MKIELGAIERLSGVVRTAGQVRSAPFRPAFALRNTWDLNDPRGWKHRNSWVSLADKPGAVRRCFVHPRVMGRYDIIARLRENEAALRSRGVAHAALFGSRARDDADPGSDGDEVVIPAVDGLSRDTTDLLVIAPDKQHVGVGLRAIAEPIVDTTSDFAEVVLAMLSVAAKLDRRRTMKRTAHGRADAKARGVVFGRKPIMTSHQQKEARARVEAGDPQRSVARSYNVSQATISRRAV